MHYPKGDVFSGIDIDNRQETITKVGHILIANPYWVLQVLGRLARLRTTIETKY